MRVYCTNPHCRHPENEIPDQFRQAKGQQRYCYNCGMRLVLRTRYLPLEQIGSGGFSRTFCTWDCNLEHECLIKQLRPTNLSNNPWTDSQLQYIQTLFKREAQTLRNLNHPQIPRLWDFFELSAPEPEEYNHDPENPKILFYLVQDYIEGKNLRQIKNEKWSEDEVINFLRQILPVLSYIHSLQPVMLIHRDIKPENIILGQNEKFYLIDFGAVKQAVAGIPVEQSIAIATPGYASPEQRAGLAVSASSDLYSLAATCVCLLTFATPEELRVGDVWNWREYVDVSEQLATILDTMLLPEINQRFQSASQVIDVLESQITSASISPQPSIPPQTPNPVIENFSELQTQPPTPLRVKNSPSWKKLFMGSLGGVILLGLGLGAWAYFRDQPANQLCIDDSRFSCGEKQLIPAPLGLGTNTDFTQGVKAFQNQNYDQAISSFDQSLKRFKQNDPETRIYLNNARAAKSQNFLKITVCVPIGNENGLSEQILRGVATVQNNINTLGNKLLNGQMLLVQICKDEYSTDIAQQVAKKIIEQDKQTLGVIGHNSSLVTLSAGKVYGNEIYGNNKLVSISATSTAVRGIKFNESNIFEINKFVFRVSPTDEKISEVLINYIIKNKRYKGAIFLNSKEPYSKSFSQAFRQKFKKMLGQKGKIVNECNLSNYQFNSVPQCLQAAKQSQADFILLTMSDDIVRQEINRILQASGEAIILGGDTAYVDSAQITQIQYGKIVVAVPWHRSSNNKLSLLEQESLKLWGTAKISYATAMAYNATQVLVEGLRKISSNPSRAALYSALSNPNFFAKGAGGKVQFNQEHDRKIDERNIQDLIFLVSPKDGEFQIIK